MDTAEPADSVKRKRFRPFIIKKGIVMRAKQRQKMSLELSKSKNDSTVYKDPKLIKLRSNNRGLSRALTEQKIENKCLFEEKIQLQKEILGNHEVIVALRNEVQMHEEDLSRINDVFRGALQQLLTLTEQLNVGLRRCNAGRRRSKSVSIGTAGSRGRSSWGLLSTQLCDPTSSQSSSVLNGSSATSRKLHKVLPTVAGNVISHPSIVLPRLSDSGGLLAAAAAAGTVRLRPADEQDEEQEEEQEAAPLAEPAGREPLSTSLNGLSVILEQSLLEPDVASPLPEAQVLVPAEERLFGDEAWMRQRQHGLERVLVPAEERLSGDEALRRQCLDAGRAAPAPEPAAGDGPVTAERRDGATPSPARPTAAPRPAAAAVCNGDAAGDTGRGPAEPELERSPPVQQPRPRQARSAAAAAAGESGMGVGPASDPARPLADTTVGDLDESVIVSRKAAAPDPNESFASRGAAAPDPDASIIVSRRAASPDPDESIIVSRRAAAPDPDESVVISRKTRRTLDSVKPAAEPGGELDESVVISRRTRGVRGSSGSSGRADELDRSAVIVRRTRRSRVGAEPPQPQRQPAVSTTPSPDEPRAVPTDNGTPSPEIGVKERYHHVLDQGAPDDPLEGPSWRVWLRQEAAATPRGRRGRGRARGRPARGRSSPPDVKLSSPAVVVLDQATTGPAVAGGRRGGGQQPASDGRRSLGASPGRGRGRGGGRGRGRGRARGRGRGRRSSAGGRSEPATPDADLFVYPELPAADPESEPRAGTPPSADGPAEPAVTPGPPAGGSVPPAAAATSESLPAPVAAGSSPSADRPGAAQPAVSQRPPGPPSAKPNPSDSGQAAAAFAQSAGAESAAVPGQTDGAECASDAGPHPAEARGQAEGGAVTHASPDQILDSPCRAPDSTMLVADSPPQDQSRPSLCSDSPPGAAGRPGSGVDGVARTEDVPGGPPETRSPAGEAAASWSAAEEPPPAADELPTGAAPLAVHQEPPPTADQQPTGVAPPAVHQLTTEGPPPSADQLPAEALPLAAAQETREAPLTAVQQTAEGLLLSAGPQETEEAPPAAVEQTAEEPPPAAGQQTTEEPVTAGSRRRRLPVSYREPCLNKKMRR